MEQGEALRMRGAVLYGEEARLGPSLPSCLTPSGEESFGASRRPGGCQDAS